MKRKRILIAEDEKCMSLTLELIIERLGHEPLCVPNGNEALEVLIGNQANNTPVDLLLCDIQMPGMSGTTLIETMRRRRIATPVLVITGYGDKELLVQLMRLGCRDFIDKPFSPQQIEERVSILVADINSHEAEVKRQEFFAAVGEVARSTVHDINNAICGTLGYADMLREETPVDHPLHSRASKIYASVSRAAEICRDLLSQDPSSVMQQHVKTDLNILVERAAALLSDVLPDTIRVTTNGSGMPTWYPADPRQLQQALLNLGFNAADAMPSGGEVRLGIHVHDKAEDLPVQAVEFLGGRGCIEIAVSDTGSGIPQNVLPRIFDEGFTTKSNGTGIGLPTVKRIVEAHGGTIEVDSQIGRGTTFRLLFPLGQPVEESSDGPMPNASVSLDGATAAVERAC